MKVGKTETTCRIFSRKRGDASTLLYLRVSDSLVVKSSVPPMTLRPTGKETGKSPGGTDEKKDEEK
jgi:hypothetical protein